MGIIQQTMSVMQNQTQNINQESNNNISLLKELEAAKQKLSVITNKLLATEAKNIKNKPLEKNKLTTNDTLPFTSFEELKKNSVVLSQRETNQKLKSLIKETETGLEGNPIYVNDLSKLVTQHLKWIENLPSVKPCYVVKCNNDYMILKTLKDFGCGFDCASMEEIRQALEIGVSPDSIIFANPVKPVTHVKYANEKGVNYLTFDNTDELEKIKKYHPNAKLILGIKLYDNSSFPMRFIKHLFQKVQDLEMDLVGISFHVGTCCG